LLMLLFADTSKPAVMDWFSVTRLRRSIAVIDGPPCGGAITVAQHDGVAVEFRRCTRRSNLDGRSGGRRRERVGVCSAVVGRSSGRAKRSRNCNVNGHVFHDAARRTVGIATGRR
jgi:hypothetical protein